MLPCSACLVLETPIFFFLHYKCLQVHTHTLKCVDDLHTEICMSAQIVICQTICN